MKLKFISRERSSVIHFSPLQNMRLKNIKNLKGVMGLIHGGADVNFVCSTY